MQCGGCQTTDAGESHSREPNCNEIARSLDGTGPLITQFFRGFGRCAVTEPKWHRSVSPWALGETATATQRSVCFQGDRPDSVIHAAP